MCSLKLLLFCVIIAVVSADDAETCSADKCKLPGCQCSGSTPNIQGKIPQFVILSFDDSASKLISESFYKTELYTRKNPDECPISGTFFIPHEYTDYTVVNDLYNHGFEIGSHSITKNYSTEYWSNATSSLIQQEMAGQRTIISKFANISIDSIIGARIPHFQLNGDNTYEGLQKSGFVYDNSWPTFSSSPFYPYTLDYRSEQHCLVGTCPNKPHKGFWVVPINNWKGMDNQECNKVLGCVAKGDTDNLFAWMMENFNRNYNTTTKQPVSLSLNYAWFTFTDNSLSALQKFLDHIKSLKDVFVVSNKQVLDWVKNPVLLDKYKSCQNVTPAECSPVNCELKNIEDSIRYMGSCVSCPKKYPWIGNPEGKA